MGAELQFDYYLDNKVVRWQSVRKSESIFLVMLKVYNHYYPAASSK